jgi:hypothetical protein
VAVSVTIAALLSGGCGNGDDDVTRDRLAEAGAVPNALEGSAGRGVAAERCSGTIGARRVAEVRVPPGSTCRLLGTTVTGQVLIGSGGRLVARRATVEGDVLGRAARRVLIASRSLIAGSVVLAHGGSSSVTHAEIRADLQMVMDTGRLTVRRTLIGGDLTANRNAGALILSGNRIGGDLRCHQNLRSPLRGQNLVAGFRAGQCALMALPGIGPRTAHHPVRRGQIPQGPWRPPCAGDSVSDDPSDDECGDD